MTGFPPGRLILLGKREGLKNDSLVRFPWIAKKFNPHMTQIIINTTFHINTFNGFLLVGALYQSDNYITALTADGKWRTSEYL